MPPLGVPTLGSSIGYCTAPPPKALPKTPLPKTRHSRETPKAKTALEDEIFQSFYNAMPFSLEAAQLIHDVVNGDSDLFKIPTKRQILLLYKVFQHCWLESLSEFISKCCTVDSLICCSEKFHKGKKASVPRFNVNPKSVASLCSESGDYVRCRLFGYPLKMRYPESASELQLWHTWEAAAYEPSDADPSSSSTLDVTDISETLVFQLIAAFLRGSEYDGDTVMLEFERYKYRNVEHSVN